MLGHDIIPIHRAQLAHSRIVPETLFDMWGISLININRCLDSTVLARERANVGKCSCSNLLQSAPNGELIDTIAAPFRSITLDGAADWSNGASSGK